jgi:hypothetical protein
MAGVHFEDETGLVTVVAGERVRVLDGAGVHRAGMVALARAASGLSGAARPCVGGHGTDVLQ